MWYCYFLSFSFDGITGDFIFLFLFVALFASATFSLVFVCVVSIRSFITANINKITELIIKKTLNR